jgi:hypothetical protein
MSTLAYKDANGDKVYMKVNGTGTVDDPFRPVSSDPGTPVAGNLNATTSAQPLSSVSVPCSRVMIFIDPDNSDDAYIGDSASQPVQLIPTKDLVIDTDNVNKVYGRVGSGSGNIPWIAIT